MSKDTMRIKVCVSSTINDIKDVTTREACHSFYELISLEKGYTKHSSRRWFYHKAFSRLKSEKLNSISIKRVVYLILFEKKAPSEMYGAFSFFYKNGYCKVIQNNPRMFMFFNSVLDTNFLMKVYNNMEVLNRTIYSCGIINHKKVYVKVTVPKGNEYISSIITDFLIYREMLMDYDFTERMSSYLYFNDVKDIFTSVNDDFISCYFNDNLDMSDRAFTLSKYFFIWVLNQLSTEEQEKSCPLYNVYVLEKSSFKRNYIKGFRPVKYNKFDSVPKLDGWLLLPNIEEINKSTVVTKSSVIAIDFGKIKNKWFRKYAKQHFWYDQSGINTKNSENDKIASFVNSFFPNANTKYSKLDGATCAKYKSYIFSTQRLTETRNSYMYPVSRFVKFIDNNNLLKVEPNCYMFLNNKGSLNMKGAKSVREDDLRLLAEYMNKHKHDSHEHLMYYTIFHICLNTEFRISQILCLMTDCVQESMKKNEYIIRSTTKVSGGEKVDQPCARIIKTIVDDYMHITACFREEILSEELKKYLFIKKNDFINVYSVVRSSHFGNFLKKACSKIGINSITPKNLRSTYITNGKEYVLANKLSDATLLGITGHRNIDTINNHYIQERIRDALQATNSIIIGEIDIMGKIVNGTETIKTSKENSVEEECGYCQVEICSMNGPLSCLLCSHFVTTIDRIPFFDRQLKKIDKLIQTSESNHDVQDYVSIKRLFAKYLEELLRIKEIN